MWGEQPPYSEIKKELVWALRLVTDSPKLFGILVLKNDYLLFQAFGPYSFFVSIFKSCVHDNSFISKMIADADIIVSSVHHTINLLNILFYCVSFFNLILTTF
ncbi:hypothetical protein HanOQP8_Chr02g0045441 [Helianthus annuus]|nr:hypothetical protein HanOQP8_Chr02g0045441 [Helianthus annuus]